MRTGNYDVLIVGGGPAGATLGALLARSGWSVGLLERERLEFYRSAIEKSIYTRQMLSGAVMTGELRCIADYSYRPRRLWGPGFLLAGDAGNFIDPVWSTGVMLATTGARLAARAIERAFRGQTCEPLAEYEAAIQRLVGRYRQFIYFSTGPTPCRTAISGRPTR